jgi:hypothetical protein
LSELTSLSLSLSHFLTHSSIEPALLHIRDLDRHHGNNLQESVLLGLEGDFMKQAILLPTDNISRANLEAAAST